MPISKSARRTAWVLLFTATLWMPLYGQAQQPPPAKPDHPAAQQDKSLPAPPPSSQQPPSRPDEQFVPSETISEDLSVPFPVDI